MANTTAADEIGSVLDNHSPSVARHVLTGFAVGVALGMLFAPRRGAESRQWLLEECSQVKNKATGGYHRVKDTASHWAHNTRELFARRAHDTSRHVEEPLRSHLSSAAAGPVSSESEMNRTATRPITDRPDPSPAAASAMR